MASSAPASTTHSRLGGTVAPAVSRASPGRVSPASAGRLASAWGELFTLLPSSSRRTKHKPRDSGGIPRGGHSLNPGAAARFLPARCGTAHPRRRFRQASPPPRHPATSTPDFAMPRLLLAVLLLLQAACAMPAVHESDVAATRGRVWVITGASSGIGRGVAERVGSMGGRVVLAARRAEALEDVARTIRAQGGEALVVPTDVSRPEAVEALAEAARQRFG